MFFAVYSGLLRGWTAPALFFRKKAAMIAFVHIEKTAGTTINRTLRRSFGLSHCDVEPWRQSDDFFSAEDYRRLRKIYPALKSIAGHTVKPYGDLGTVCPNIRYYTFLRDPVGRCISHFQNNILLGWDVSLEQWLEYEAHRNFQTRKLAGCDDADRAIELLHEKKCFVGLVERFDESMVLLKQHLGIKGLDIRYRSKNIAGPSDMRTRLLESPAHRAMLEEANRADIALYEHAASAIYPQQVTRYGPALGADVAAFQGSSTPGSLGRIPEMLNFAYRQIVYKPFLKLYRKRHGLPTRTWSKA